MNQLFKLLYRLCVTTFGALAAVPSRWTWGQEGRGATFECATVPLFDGLHRREADELDLPNCESFDKTIYRKINGCDRSRAQLLLAASENDAYPIEASVKLLRDMQ